MHWILIFLLFISDISTKVWAEKVLLGNPKYILFGRVKLTYLRNYGIVFNKLNHKKVLILVINFLLLFYIGYLMLDKTYNITGLSFVMAGGLGNSLNRLYSGYVIDFIYFRTIKSPIFNLADFYVFGGMALLILDEFAVI